MNRRLIWIIAGVSVLGLGVPAFAAARGGDGTPEDNGVPGDVRGNCDEAEHANDPECLDADPSTTSIVVTVPATLPATETSVPDSSVPDSSVPDSSVPDSSVPDNSVPDNSVPDNSVPSASTPVNTVEDISGPCDEAEHVNDPRCTGAPRVDNSGPGSLDDDGDADEDNSGSGNSHDDDGDDDDRSGHGGGDDDDNGGDDDNSGHGGDDD